MAAFSLCLLQLGASDYVGGGYPHLRRNRQRIATRSAAEAAPSPEAVGGGVWASLAEGARKWKADVAAFEAKEKNANVRIASRGVMASLGSISSGFDAAAKAAVPLWAPFASIGAAALLAVCISFVSTPVQAPPAAPAKILPSVSVVASPPVVRKIEAPPAPAPAPAPAPVKPPPPAISVPSPVPAANAATPSVLAPAPKPVPAPAPAPAASGGGIATQIANVAALGLRSTADLLPQATIVVEREAPKVIAGLQSLKDVKPENVQEKAAAALPAVGDVLESAGRAGLKAGAFGLKVTAETLPAASNVIGKGVESATPAVTSALKAGADVSRDFAVKLADPSLMPKEVPVELRDAFRSAAPMVLKTTASGLDALASVTPQASKTLTFLGGKLTPVVQATLNATSDITDEVSKVQLDKKGLADGAKEVARSASQLASKAQETFRAASEAASQATAQATAPVPKKAKAAKAVRVTADAAAVAAPVAATAAPDAAPVAPVAAPESPAAPPVAAAATLVAAPTVAAATQ